MVIQSMKACDIQAIIWPKRVSILFFLWCVICMPVLAQQPEVAEPIPLTEAEQEQLTDLQTSFEQQQQLVSDIEERIATADEELMEVLEVRLTRGRIAAISTSLAYSNAVLGFESAGRVIEAFESTAVEMLQLSIAEAESSWVRLTNRLDYPDASIDASEQARLNQIFFEELRDQDRLMVLLADCYERLESFGIDVEAALAALRDRFDDRAVGTSIYLDLAVQEASGYRAAADALPDDTELAARVTVAQARVSAIAASLQRVITEMSALGIETETTVYREQLVAVTGEITQGLLDIQVVWNMISGWGQSFMNYLRTEGPTFLFRVLIVLIILFIAHRLSVIIRSLVERGLNRSDAHLSQLLRRMMISTAANLVLAVGILIALSQIGISLGPLLAGLGIAGFVIGFALQDTLSNFASGLMILFYRPFDVGDIVEVEGMLGKVEEMSLVNTTIHTVDNQRIIMPNTKIWGGIIKNVTAQAMRRVDLLFGISYADDIAKTEKVLKQIIDDNELVLDEPEPVIRLHELGDSSVNFVVRPWTKTENYWEVFWSITREVKIRFDEEGISIPFPQRDVHLFAESSGSSEATAEDAGQKPKQVTDSTASAKSKTPDDKSADDISDAGKKPGIRKEKKIMDEIQPYEQTIDDDDDSEVT